MKKSGALIAVAIFLSLPGCQQAAAADGDQD